MSRALPVLLLVAALAGARVAAAGDPVPRLTDVTKAAGIDFVHDHGGFGDKYMIETMGGGVAFLDMDRDGDLDLLFVQSGPVPGFEIDGKGRAAYPNRLYENLGDGTFRDVTVGSGIEGKRYGMGVAVGDVDGDGLPDVYITCFGRDELYRNLGKGKWKDVTDAAGAINDRWGMSAAFADLDGDGDLDLYVTNYVDFAMDHNVWCGERKEGWRAYCHPDAYGPLPDVLFENQGDGTFRDVTKAAGVAIGDGKGLGVVAGDYDDDGRIDLYVANDSTRNYLFHNVTEEKDGRRRMQLEEDTLLAGVGYSETGKTEAGMGVDMADADGDGRLDLLVTNLDLEPNELYVNRGDTFKIATYPSGLGEPSLPFVGFGTGLVDLDNDGDLDVFVGNGHVIDNFELYRKGAKHAQPKLLHLNRGDGTFVDVSKVGGEALTRPEVSRGVAFGDYDDDGDIDIAICNNNAPAVLLRNDGPAGKKEPGAIVLALRGKAPNTAALGARVTATIGGRKLVREAHAAMSYLASCDSRVHLGLGGATSASHITVRWPSGRVTELTDVKAGIVEVAEP